MVVAFIGATGATTQLAAQATTETLKTKTKSNQTNEKTAGWNLKENVKGRVSSSATGCDIVFTHEVTSPRDAASGLATGRRQHKPYGFSVSAADNSVEESNAGSAAKTTGGKVSFSDLSVMITIKGKSQKLTVTDGEFSLPTDCPDGVCAMSVSWSWGATNTSSKSCAVDFLLEIEDGACKQVNKSKSNVKNN